MADRMNSIPSVASWGTSLGSACNRRPQEKVTGALWKQQVSSWIPDNTKSSAKLAVRSGKYELWFNLVKSTADSFLLLCAWESIPFSSQARQMSTFFHSRCITFSTWYPLMSAPEPRAMNVPARWSQFWQFQMTELNIQYSLKWESAERCQGWADSHVQDFHQGDWSLHLIWN